MITKFNTKQYLLLNTDLGLLLLRVLTATVLFSKHGLEKIVSFNQMLPSFPDPLGVGSTAGLSFAFACDVVCALLMALGLFTRFGAALQLLGMIVIFSFLHNFSFAEEHAEIVFLYLAVYLTVFCAGQGKYSLDRLITTSNRTTINQ